MQTLMIFWSSWRLEMIVSERQQTPTLHTSKKEEGKEGVAEGREFGLVQFSRASQWMVRTMEKSRARQTINDAPLPKVNWYLCHIFFLCFSKFSFYLICFSPLHVWNFQICFMHAGIFLALFPFHKNTKNIFWVLNPLGKIIWTSFRANFWPCTIFSKFMTVEDSPGQRGAPRGRPRANGSWAPPSPTATWPLCLALPRVHSPKFL